MSELSSVAKDLAKEVAELVGDIDGFEYPPSKTQLETVQEALDHRGWLRTKSIGNRRAVSPFWGQAPILSPR